MRCPLCQTCEQQTRWPVTLSQWPLFPLNIRLLVFEKLAQHSSHNENSTTPMKPSLARYAAVCKEWQAFFEKILYRRLVLKQTCLDEFDKVVRRRKGLVQHIWLRIELGTYSCPACMGFEDPLRHTADETVNEALMKLFLILSTWVKPDVTPHGGLTLEISIYSPSDSQHNFSGDLHLGPDPFETEEDERQRFRTHDPYHGWRQGRRLDRPNIAAISSLLTTISPEVREELPSVKVVTSFILRRQTRRALSTESLQKIFKSLPGLECINYEPWREFFRWPRYLQDPGYQNIILTSLPETLKALTIFEDFNEDYNIVHCFNYSTREWLYPPELVRTPNPSVGAALAYRSLSLERFSASNMVDANDFFRACEPNWAWDNLTSLTLTSRLLTLCKPHLLPINKMLVDAGTAALRMPHLRTLVIWNGMKRNACAFRYQVTANSTTLGWCGTWDLELDIDVLDVWRNAALRYTKHELSILASRNLNKQDIKSHAVAIRELDLREVIHPVSLEQILRESGRYFYR
ncbi:hypothetical protein DL764_007381 [Monosporascus ibericus]|uniref:DUF6546 domain-containing protein n=1 Tax=Monosporascus ibericus TaxID=155417 RepID=A0A4Q4T1A5_9PEZI|nr:hypothetical protein DL764_007381 [Monosporascus ibericus]